MLDAAQSEVGCEPMATLRPALTPEMEVVLACAQAFSAASPPRLHLNRPLDSERLLQETGRHGLSTLMHRWLNEGALPASAIPPGFRQALEERYRTYIRQSLQHTAVLVELMELFRRSGLTALPYKGPTLSVQLFGDPALREAVDLDILLPPDEINAACDQLTAAGFSRTRVYAPGLEKQLLRYRAEVAMIRDGVMVELQWRLAPHYFSVPMDVRALAARATRVRVADAELPALSPEDSLLVLCIHGGKHHWHSLKWLVDVALVIRKNPNLSWTTLRERARATGTERLLGLGLLLSETLLGVSLTAGISEDIRRDLALHSAAKDVVAGIAALHNPTEAEHHRLMLKLRERFSDRATYVFRLGWEPTETEWEKIRLPRGLQFAYHGVRVGRVLAKALGWQ